MANELDLKGFKGFCIVEKDPSPEAMHIIARCKTDDIPLMTVPRYKKCPKDYVPMGSVEWCLFSMERNITPDYYPEFLSNFLRRDIWYGDKWILDKVFVKPADRYKRFDGFVTTGTYKNKKKPPFVFSKVVHFENEWRYYISNGKCVGSGWYWGDQVNTPEPPSPYLFVDQLPKGFCGAVDFGTYNGKFTLVECHHPFACGWYNNYSTVRSYMQWLVDGWIYMRSNYGI